MPDEPVDVVHPDVVSIDVIGAGIPSAGDGGLGGCALVCGSGTNGYVLTVGLVPDDVHFDTVCLDFLECRDLSCSLGTETVTSTHGKPCDGH